jgi:hypothetical protein
MFESMVINKNCAYKEDKREPLLQNAWLTLSSEALGFSAIRTVAARVSFFLWGHLYTKWKFKVQNCGRS